MKFSVMAFLSFLPIAACQQDETLSGYAETDRIYVLQSLNGESFGPRATLVLQTGGTISGDGPCNSWRAEQSAPYPWWDVGPIAATRRACPELAAEQAYFDALGAMTLSEVSGDVLILSTTEGGEMVFRAE